MDLLSALQGAGEAIDKGTGGRAVRGLLAGKPRELLSPIPFSDSMGLTDHKDATSGRDLTDAYGLTDKNSNSFGSHAAGFLADNILSPANMLGGYGAFKAAPTLAKGITSGAKALTGLDMVDHLASGGRAVGNFLKGESGYLKVPLSGIPDEMAGAADALGPMYSGGTGKLLRASGAVPMPDLPVFPPGVNLNPYTIAKNTQQATVERIRKMAQSEFGERLAMEMPKGSSFLGSGAESIVFKSPQGGVIRVGDQNFSKSSRPAIQEMLQPYRHAIIGPYSVEHLPFVNPAPGLPADIKKDADAIRRILHNKGYDPWDVNPRNISATNEGNYIIHDGGAVSDMVGRKARGIADPYQKLEMPEGDLVKALLGIGAPKAVRQSIRAGASAGTVGQGVNPGSLLEMLQGSRVADDGFRDSQFSVW